MDVIARSSVPLLINFYISELDSSNISLVISDKKLETIITDMFRKRSNERFETVLKRIDKAFSSKPSFTIDDMVVKANSNHSNKTAKKRKLVNKKETLQYSSSRTLSMLKDMKKTSDKYLKIFYSTLNGIYSKNLDTRRRNFSSYIQLDLYKSPKTVTENSQNGLVNYQEHNFQFKKKKGGDFLLDLVAYSQVNSVDYAEEMEIQRVSKMASMGLKNHIDPEALERHKYWSLFSFNQTMSWFYYDFAI